MPLTQTDVGDRKSLDLIRAAWNGAAALTVRLFKNNYTPVEGSVAADFTTPDYNGYAAQVAANWTAAHTVGVKAQTEADPLIFSHTAGATSNTIYGYFVQPANDATAVWYAERFATAVVLAVDGDALVLYLRYTQDTE